MADKITPFEAKKNLAAHLKALGFNYTKLTARTVRFTDLARSECVFVKIHGWQPHPGYSLVTDFAVENGFRVETDV